MAHVHRKKALGALLLALGTTAFADVALAYPFQVKNGYPGCAGCHVAPAGGGALTAYGRLTIAERMATWSTKYEAEPLHGIAQGKWPEWLAVGGDTRYINVTQKNPDVSRHVKFFMQRDAEIAVIANEHVTFAASAGVYGPDEGTGEELEIRKHYLKIGLTPGTAVRLGRFGVAYGIAEPDHTLSTRRGLGQGNEAYAAEASVLTRYGEAFATALLGSEAEITASKTKGYSHAPSYPQGYALRAAAYFLGSGQAGLSIMRVATAETITRSSASVHVQTGITQDTYLLAELGRVKETDLPAETVAMTRVGWEFLKGMHLLATYELDGHAYSPGAALQWFPRPHWELQAQAKRTTEGESFMDSGILQFHYYL